MAANGPAPTRAAVTAFAEQWSQREVMRLTLIPVPLHGRIIDIAYRTRVDGRLHPIRLAKKPKPVRKPKPKPPRKGY